MTQEDVVGRVVEVLRRLEVPYMVAGALASNLHGVPRMTQDADLVVDLDEAAVPELFESLESEFYVSAGRASRLALSRTMGCVARPRRPPRAGTSGRAVPSVSRRRSA